MISLEYLITPARDLTSFVVRSNKLPQEVRRLAAIMFTDMVGYTTLGQKNESLSLALVEEQRELLRPIFKRHNGREVNTMGDAFLVEFPSALEAVRCGYEVQKAVREFNFSLTDEKRIHVRVGVHLGDVVESKGDILGDAVNVASRIEPLAEDGGVCITRQVYDHVQNKFELPLVSLGNESLKNVSTPVEVYRVVMPWNEEMKMPVVEQYKSSPIPAPFFGRQQELSFLSGQFDSVKIGRGMVVLIGGEAGVGKTSLVQSFMSKLEKQEVNIARGYCLAEVSIPYFPFVAALDTLLGGRKDSSSTGVLKWLSDPEIGFRASLQSRDQVFDLVIRKLGEGSTNRPLILFLDDLHWADSTSLALLHFLARNTKDNKVLILGTYRTEELGDLAPGKPHPLVETMRLMNREGLFVKLELSSLETETINEVTRSVIGGASNQLLQLIAKESEGNPFYAVESSRFLKDSGALELVSGAYALKESRASIQIPSSVLDMIARRLSRLADPSKQLIDCASVIGEHFDPKILALALKLDELSTIQSLDALSRNTRLILEEGEEGLFRFEHAKIKEAVYQGLGRALTKHLHHRVAEVLFQLYGLEKVQELAYHYHSAGNRDKTIEFGLIAGDQAKQQFAYAESTSYYAWAIDAMKELKEHDELRASALARRAESLSLQGFHQQAIADSKQALAISMDYSVRILALLVCAISWRSMGHFSEALECIQMGEAEPGGEKIERLRFKEEKALVLSRRGENEAAEVIWQEVGRGYREMGGKREYALSLYYLQEDAILSLHSALKIFEEIGDLELAEKIYFELGFRYFNGGEVKRSSEYYSKASELARKIGNFDSLIWAQMYWSFALDAAGEFEEELQLSLKALATAALSETPYPETGVNCNLVRCYMRKNEPQEAERAFIKMNELYEKHSKDASLGIQGFVARARGFYFASLGQWSEADQAYAASIDLFSRFMEIHEAETRREYAEWLIKQNKKKEALGQLVVALSKYEKLENESGIEKTNEMMERSRQ
jgi:class 3 adenylate cyclase/tetratricopeptide (TPR) repeat protein